MTLGTPCKIRALAHEACIRELYKQLFGEELEHVTPSHDTLRIVPCKSHSPQGLQGGLSKLWIVDLLQWDEQTRQICIDGKTMRGVKNAQSGYKVAYFLCL